MATATSSTEMERQNTDAAKLELYRLLGEGYKAMQEFEMITKLRAARRIERPQGYCNMGSNLRYCRYC